MNKNSDWYELSVGILNIFKINRRFLCECYCQGSGSHEIAFILLEIVLTVALHFSMGKAQKSRWVKRKRLNGSRMFIFYTSATEKSCFHSVRCYIQRTRNWYRIYRHVHVWGHLCKKKILTWFISVLKLITNLLVNWRISDCQKQYYRL